MGESYLHRKLFGRTSRLKAQGSLTSSSAQSTSLESRWSPGGQPQSSSHEMIPSGSSKRRQVSSSYQEEEEDESFESDAEEQTSISIKRQQQTSSDCHIAPLNTNPRIRSPESSSCSVSSQLTSGLRSRAGGESMTDGQNKQVSRLKSASRAILFFRRTASSLMAKGSSKQPQQQQQEVTTGNGSLISDQRKQQTQVMKKMNSTNSNSTTNSSINNQQQVNSAISNQHPVPQFIVPKMNALKLPLVCLIKSLDGELMREVFVHRYELGQYLIESLKVSVGISDCKYFGLKMANSFEEQEDLRNSWLDLNESVCKQIKSGKGQLIKVNQPTARATTTTSCSSQSICSSASNGQSLPAQLFNGCGARFSVDFYLRIKFYPPNLARVQDPFLRNYLWLQLRRDLRLGKLTSSMNNLSLLMACILQHDLGDYRSELVEQVLPEMSILPNQDLIEEQAIGVWRSGRLFGAKRHQAQMQFLRAAVILETYGFDYYPVRDHQRQRAYLLGFNYAGVKTIRNGRIVHHFSWHSMSKISQERRMIIFHVYPTDNSKRKQVLGFKCLTNDDCQQLYMRLLEQKYFFTVDLAYFDKSLPRRPSCLHPQPSSSASGSGPAADPLLQHQRQPSYCDDLLPADCATTGEGPTAECPDCDGRQLTGSDGGQQQAAQTEASGDPQVNDGQQVTGNSDADGQLPRRQSRLQRQPATPKYEAHWPPQSSRWPLPPREDDQRANQLPANGIEAKDKGSVRQIDDSLWTRSCKLLPGGLSRRLGEVFGEHLNLLGPATATIVQCIEGRGLGGRRQQGTELELELVQTNSSSATALLAPAIRFCLIILAMNFVIRWTDKASNFLIELLTT